MRKCITAVLCLLCILGLAGCGREETDPGKTYQVFYVSNSETKVEAHPYVMSGVTAEEQLQELVSCLSTIPDKLEYKAPFAMGFEVLDMEIEDGRLLLDVSAAYKEMSPTTEVLVRAAIVRTLTQISDIGYVGITVEGEQLFDNLQNPVGWMSADQFIDNEGSEINTYEVVRVKLYFANENGDGLIPAFREKHYNTNVPLEKFVVEELISGPGSNLEGIYPSINPNTKIISIMVKDGICYVNLDETFSTVINNVSTEVSIYSIVNSLVELSNVNKVQVLIDGEVPVIFKDKADFNPVLERNLELVTTVEENQ